MSAMITTTTAPAQRSWAQIAKDKSSNVDAKGSQTRLKPGTRGSLMCFCRGKVLEMLNNYGWLMVYGQVDHASSEKHAGHVYVSKWDVEDGETLLRGDTVSFHLYVDEKGLGAERVALEERGSSTFNPEAPEFVPTAEKSGGHKMSATADEFVPSIAWSAPSMAVPTQNDKSHEDFPHHDITNVFARLSQVFVSDDDDDDDDDDGYDLDFQNHDITNVFARLSQVFISDDDDVDTDSDSDISSKHGQLSVCKMSSKVKRSASPDGSTSAGTASDSEGESSCDSFPVLAQKAPRRALPTTLNFRPPPGLSLPPNFRLPPGLSLPDLSIRTAEIQQWC